MIFRIIFKRQEKTRKDKKGQKVNYNYATKEISFFFFFAFVGSLFAMEMHQERDVQQQQSTVTIERPLLTLETSKPFERVVTLGDCCMPKKQVNLYFSAKFPNHSVDEFTGGSYLFDWVLTWNLKALAQGIENNFANIAENFSVPSNTITDGAGVGYLHILPGKEWKHTQADLQILPMDKITYLRNKTQQAILSPLKTLFIFSIKNTRTTPQDVMRLHEALKAVRKNQSFQLVCTMESCIPQHSEIMFYQLAPCDGYKKWLYNALPQWAEVLNQFQFSPVAKT